MSSFLKKEQEGALTDLSDEQLEVVAGGRHHQRRKDPPPASNPSGPTYPSIKDPIVTIHPSGAVPITINGQTFWATPI